MMMRDVAVVLVAAVAVAVAVVSAVVPQIVAEAKSVNASELQLVEQIAYGKKLKHISLR